MSEIRKCTHNAAYSNVTSRSRAIKVVVNFVTLFVFIPAAKSPPSQLSICQYFFSFMST